MAERQGEILLPQDRERWGEAFKAGPTNKNSLITPKGLKALEDALSLYAPYTTDQFEQNPSLLIPKALEAQPYIDEAVAGIILAIQMKHFRKGLLKQDVLTTIIELQRAILQKYPEYGQPGARFSEGIILNPLIERIQAYLLTLIALGESRYRKQTKTIGQRPIRAEGRVQYIPVKEVVQKGFFGIIDKESRPLQVATGGKRIINENPVEIFEQRLRSQYELIKMWMAFLKGQIGAIQNPESLKRDDLKRHNDKVASLLRSHATRDYPVGLTIDDITSLSGEERPLMMHITPLKDSRMPQFHECDVMVSYLEGEEGKDIVADPKERERLIPQKAWDHSDVEFFIFSSFGIRPPVTLRRLDADLTSATLYTDSLKLIAGESASYELLRRDVLWHLTQIVCTREILQQMWGNAFAPKEKTLKRQGTMSPRGDEPSPEPGDKPRNESGETDRHYPRGEESLTAAQLADAIFRALEEGEEIDISTEEEAEPHVIPPEDVEEKVGDTLERVLRKHVVTGYKRILPPIKVRKLNPDGTEKIVIKAPRPSREAQKRAAEAQKTLRKGISFVTTGITVKPEQVGELLKRFSVSTLEELEERYKGEAFIVYETYVSSYERGREEAGVVETIRATVQEEVSKEPPQ